MNPKIKKTLKLLWIGLLSLLVVLPAFVFFTGLLFFNFLAALITPLMLFLALAGYTLAASWKQIPEKEEWTITLFGSDVGESWKSGLHFLFPFFTEISGKVYMGTQAILLVLKGDREIRRDEVGNFDGHIETKGLLEFGDCSAGALFSIFYRIGDARKAVYNVDFIRQGIADVVDGALRSTLSGLTVDQASGKSGLEIMNGYTRRKEGESKEKKIIGIKKRTKKTFEHWGVEITDLKLDIVLLPEIMEQRIKTLQAERDAEVTRINADADAYEKETVAEGQAKAIRTIAKAEKKSRELQGEGRAQEIEVIANKTDLNNKDAAEYVRMMDFIEKLPDKTLIIGADSGNAAQIGAGIAAASSLKNESS